MKYQRRNPEARILSGDARRKSNQTLKLATPIFNPYISDGHKTYLVALFTNLLPTIARNSIIVLPRIDRKVQSGIQIRALRKDIWSKREKYTMKLNIANRRQARGQGMTEYIIIVAVIALAAVGTYSYFGKSVRNQTAALASALAGDKDGAAKARNDAKTSGTAASSEAATAKGLANFYEGTAGK